jgi:hypothetical protein
MDPDGDGEVTSDEFRNWWFRKLNAQRKKEEETRDLQFKKDAFWARRGRGQQQESGTDPKQQPTSRVFFFLSTGLVLGL